MLRHPRRHPSHRGPALPAGVILVGALLGALAVALCGMPAAPARAAERPGDLGRVDFPTSGPPAAQEHFLRGVAALHNFWYDEAADAFRAAQKADPGFAMAYWGEAMTYNHPIWQEVDTDAAKAVLARLGATPGERAAKAPTPREKAYLQAVEVLYGEGEKPARDRAYSAAMAALAARFPDDGEAAAFHALSILGLTRPGNPADFPALMRAAAPLEELLDENPDHPGVLHYLIHIYDDPIHAPLGLRAARRYARVAPAAHHALHMPSHIFVQLGMWPEVAASNEEAWAASVAWTEQRGHGIEKRDFHSLGWLGYAYLQQGRLGKAREVLEVARRSADEVKSDRVAGGLARLEARYAIETRQWQHAPAPREAGEEAAGHVHGPAADAEGSSVFAAGLKAGFSGDPEGAERMAKRLGELAAAGAGDSGGGYSAKGLQVMEKEVAGMALLARGKKEEALARLAEAAALEESLPAPSGPPEPAKPALELYGEVLLGEGQAKEAAAQFEKSLARTPNRSLSLLGAARAAAKLGEEARARDLYAKLAGNWSQADAGDAGVAELDEVKGYAAAAAR